MGLEPPPPVPLTHTHAHPHTDQCVTGGDGADGGEDARGQLPQPGRDGGEAAQGALVGLCVCIVVMGEGGGGVVAFALLPHRWSAYDDVYS